MATFLDEKLTEDWAAQFRRFITAVSALRYTIAGVVNGYALARSVAFELKAAALSACAPTTISFISLHL